MQCERRELRTYAGELIQCERRELRTFAGELMQCERTQENSEGSCSSKA
jgi:hypothetical protein